MRKKQATSLLVAEGGTLYRWFFQLFAENLIILYPRKGSNSDVAYMWTKRTD